MPERPGLRRIAAPISGMTRRPPARFAARGRIPCGLRSTPESPPPTPTPRRPAPHARGKIMYKVARLRMYSVHPELVPISRSWPWPGRPTWQRAERPPRQRSVTGPPIPGRISCPRRTVVVEVGGQPPARRSTSCHPPTPRAGRSALPRQSIHDSCPRRRNPGCPPVMGGKPSSPEHRHPEIVGKKSRKIAEGAKRRRSADRVPAPRCTGQVLIDADHHARNRERIRRRRCARNGVVTAAEQLTDDQPGGTPSSPARAGHKVREDNTRHHPSKQVTERLAGCHGAQFRKRGQSALAWQETSIAGTM